MTISGVDVSVSRGFLVELKISGCSGSTPTVFNTVGADYYFGEGPETFDFGAYQIDTAGCSMTAVTVEFENP